jgi:hypothetical protein
MYWRTADLSAWGGDWQAMGRSISPYNSVKVHATLGHVGTSLADVLLPTVDGSLTMYYPMTNLGCYTS